MKNDMQIRSIIELDFFERLKVLFGRLIVLDTYISTDVPFERANHSSNAFVETKSKINHWKTKPDFKAKELK